MVCRTQTKPRSDIGRRGEMFGEVSRCLTMKTAVHHDTHLVSYPLLHMKLIVEEWRQATIKLPCVTDHTGGSNEHSLQLVSNRLRRPCIDCVTIVDARARRDKSMHEGCHRSIVEWLPDTTKLTKPMEAGCTRLEIAPISFVGNSYCIYLTGKSNNCLYSSSNERLKWRHTDTAHSLFHVAAENITNNKVTTDQSC